MNTRDLTPLQKRRMFTLGALAVVLVALLLFHQKGGGYGVVRIVYFAVILGLFFTRTMYSARRGTSRRNGRRQPSNVVPEAIDDPPPRPHAAPGWVRDNADPTIERYWDGHSWIRRRRWDGKEWIEGG